MMLDDISIHKDSIYIVSVGAQTPLGRCALSSAAAVRCNLSAYSDHPFMIDRHGKPIVVARAGWLDENLPWEDRIVSLGVRAANEALKPIVARSETLRRHLSVYIALSEESLSDPARRQRVLDRFADEISFAVARPAIESIVEGHAGGLLALESAFHRLRLGDAQFCLVGGVDSSLEPKQLEALDIAGRLNSANWSWGFTPGEAAGFCLVTTGGVASHLGLTPLAELLGVATAREAKLMRTQTVCIGEGLTAAFRGVLDPRHRVAHSYCDLNGETYRADEFGFAICRTREAFEDAGGFTAPAECWGDVGAASGLLSLMLPLTAWSRGYSKGAVKLVWSSSASMPLRAAALLKQPPS